MRGLVLWTGCPNCRKLVTELGQPLYRKLDRQNLVYYTDGPPAAQAGVALLRAAALAAAGENSYLLGQRMVSKDGLATCALAKGEK